MRGWPIGYLQCMEELNSGPPKTNPSCGTEEDLNPGSLNYQSSALPLGHASLSRNPSEANLRSGFIVWMNVYRFYQTFTRLVECLLILEMLLAKRNTSHYVCTAIFWRVLLKVCLTARLLYFIESDKKCGNKQWFSISLHKVLNCWTQFHDSWQPEKLCKFTRRSDWRWE